MYFKKFNVAINKKQKKNSLRRYSVVLIFLILHANKNIFFKLVLEFSNNYFELNLFQLKKRAFFE